jgi:hypothetical protein
LPHATCCHTFRATGITTYLHNGGTIEYAQQIARSAIANHESPRMTKLYDRANDAIRAETIITDGLSLDEMERKSSVCLELGFLKNPVKGERL